MRRGLLQWRGVLAEWLSPVKGATAICAREKKYGLYHQLNVGTDNSLNPNWVEVDTMRKNNSLIEASK